MNRNKNLIKIMAAAMAGVLIFQNGCLALAEADKEETVYAIADATGSVREIIVSNWLKNAENLKILEDSSILEDIVNTEGDETFSQNGGELTWNAEGNDIYYQGTTDKELPLSVHITYYLDGEEIQPEELSGKSGKVVIRYEYTNRQTKTVQVQGTDETICVPFTVISGMVFSNGCVKSAEVNSGKVITEDDQTIVVGMAFPGLKESLNPEEDTEEDGLDIEADIPDYVEVSMEAEDFEMDMAASVVFSDILEGLDLDGNDGLDELGDDLDELSDGAEELADGSRELSDGVEELYDKVPELTDGVRELKDGIVEYTDGVTLVKDGMDSLKSGSSQIEEGAASAADGAEELSDGAAGLYEGAISLKEGSKTLEDGALGAFAGATQLLSGYAGETGAVSGAKSLAEGAAALDQGMDILASGAASAASGADELSAGISQADAGAGELREGAARLQTGADGLAKGTAALTDGSAGLARGTEQVSAGLARIIQELEGDADSQTSGKLGELKTALENIRAAVGSEEESAYSIRNSYDAICRDVQILYDYYTGDASRNAAQSSGSEEGTVDELKASAQMAKNTARAAAGTAAEEQEQAQASSVSIGNNLDAAQAGMTSAQEQISAANGTYESAMGAYSPLLSDIKDTLNNTGLSKYAGYVDDGENTASAIAEGYRQAAGYYEAAAESYEAGAGEYQAAADSYESAGAAYDQAVEAYEKTIADYEAIISQYEQMLASGTELKQSAGGGTSDEESVPAQQSTEMPQKTGAETEQQVAEAWQDLTYQLGILDMIQNGNQDAGETGLTDSLELLEDSLFGKAEDKEDQGSMGELTASLRMLYDAVGSADTENTDTLLGASRALYAGNVQLSDGALELSDGARQVSAGAVSLEDGLNQLMAGAASLSGGTKAVTAGAQEAKTGSSQLAQGAGALYTGIDALYAGTQELGSGLEALAAGSKDLSAGSKTLSGGAQKLSGGAGALAAGTEVLAAGARELDDGVSTLQSGVNELNENSPSLADGAAKLSDGSDELADGVEELKDGAEELRDGMEELNEDGIQKLTDYFDENIEKLADRLLALQEAGADYRSFSGISDEMDGAVKFIIKTDAITLLFRCELD